MVVRASRGAETLLPFGEVARRLRILSQSYVGVRPIPVDRIVGSVDRTVDFDRRFRPRRRGMAARLRALGEAFSEESQAAFPPIKVYEAGGAYFVIDGHHRVALARERRMAYLDAEVTELRTSLEIGPDVDVRQLIHTDQLRRFLDESGLEELRPAAGIQLSRPNRYGELLELVKAHAFDMARREGRLVSPAEGAADWFDRVYVPCVEAARKVDLQGRHNHKTDADIFLWVYDKLRELRVSDPKATFEEAARVARTEGVSRAQRKAFLRDKVPPLPRRMSPPAEASDEDQRTREAP
jgi:hypothetical protein